LQELNWRPIINDKSHGNASGRTIWLNQHVLSFQFLVQVINFKSNVWYSFYKLWQGAIGFISHPLDAIGIVIISRNVYLEIF